MPTPSPETAPAENYPFQAYIENVSAHDLPLLNGLANIVSQEIDSRAPQFATIALDLAIENPLELRWRAQSRPPNAIPLSNQYRVAVLRDLKQSNGGEAPSHDDYADALHGRMRQTIAQRHELGVATCLMAIATGQSDLQSRVALGAPRKTDGLLLRPRHEAWQEIRRQHVDPRYKDHVERFARYRAQGSLASRIKARNGLLVAVAAFAVHHSRQGS